MAKVRFTASVLVLFALMARPSLALGPVSYGLVLGSPQTLALTIEAPVHRSLIVQASAGTIVKYSSITARMLAIADSGKFAPYGFAGGGLLFEIEMDTSAGGTTGFYWLGAGVRMEEGGANLYAELGVIGGMDRDVTSSSSRVAGAIGIVF